MIKPSNILKPLILSILLINSYAQEHPTLFSQLGTPLYKTDKDFKTLANLPLFKDEHTEINNYIISLNKTRQEGLNADSSQDKQEIDKYFKNLRQLQKVHDKIQRSYKQKLYKSIYEKDIQKFYILISTPLSFIKADARLKEKVVSFYKQSKVSSHCTNTKYLNTLVKDFDLDEKSYAYLDQMFQIHQEKLSVQVRDSLNEFIPHSNLKNPVQMVSIKTKNGFELYLENNAYYDVSIKLVASKIMNLQASEPLPYFNSYPARSRSKVIEFEIIDSKKASAFKTQYSTMIGRLNPNYDNNYLYALPYKRGQAFTLTQGFNGNATHKGKSAYALDFNLPIGSEVHAMRDGIVTALEEKHTEHGFSAEYASKANYIIIQHDDGTMAMYGHLNTNGVRVRLGERVYKHKFIGYSGNTGYSSGPHLHVHITAIKSFTTGANSIPFKFLSKRGRIDSPTERFIYIAK